MKLIRRDKYMNELYALKGKPDMKIITGVRRSGKSVLLGMFIEELKAIEPEANIARIDYSDLSFEHLKDAAKLHEFALRSHRKGKANYLFIDEVQDCPGFEKAINSLHNKGIFDIYLTGSNAFLLSSDLASLFTGRYIELPVFPFSFAEFCSYFDYEDLQSAFASYLEMGGFAGAYPYEGEQRRSSYVRNVIDAVILKDVVKRYGVANETMLSNIASFLMDNIGNLTNPNSIANYLKSQGQGIDRKTVDSYLDYLCRAFVFYKVNRFDVKGKSLLSTNAKFYLVDNGARVARVGHRNLDFGRVCENAVAIELLRRGYEVYVGKLYESEVDFIAMRGNEKIYIQVSDNIAEEATLERELRPLRRIKDAYPKLLLANTRLPSYDIEGIKVIDLPKWLLG